MFVFGAMVELAIILVVYQTNKLFGNRKAYESMEVRNNVPAPTKELGYGNNSVQLQVRESVRTRSISVGEKRIANNTYNNGYNDAEMNHRNIQNNQEGNHSCLMKIPLITKIDFAAFVMFNISYFVVNVIYWLKIKQL